MNSFLFKRKLKTAQKGRGAHEKSEEKLTVELSKDLENKELEDSVDSSAPGQTEIMEPSFSQSDNSSVKSHSIVTAIETEVPHFDKDEQDQDKTDNSEEEVQVENSDYLFDDDIVLLTYKRNGLITLKEQLLKNMQAERNEIEALKEKLDSTSSSTTVNQIIPKQECLDEVMALLQKENQILQIKKINLVRQIIEQKELCIELSAQLRLASNDNYLSNFNKHEVTHF